MEKNTPKLVKPVLKKASGNPPPPPPPPCPLSSTCDTCMSALETLKTMQEETRHSYDCHTMAFNKKCIGVCEISKTAMIGSVELNSFRGNDQNACEACFRLGHCHLQQCEDWKKAADEDAMQEQRNHNQRKTAFETPDVS